jgi:competence protein ComEC
MDFSHGGDRDVKRGKANVQILFLALLTAIRLDYNFSRDYDTLQKIDSFTDGFSQIEVQILDISRSKGDIQEIIFKYEGIQVVGYADWFEKIMIGDLCNIYTKLEEPKNFDDFDYRGYLKNKNIYLRASRVEVVDCKDKKSIKNPQDIFLWLKRNLMILRKSLSVQVEKYLPEPQSSLLIGILFGSERAFSEEFEDSLRISGTTHIIAASGYNITILILAIGKILGFVNKKWRLILSLLIIWLYCILSGLGASILRATMMGTITILALLSGNVRNTHILMPTGVFFLILINPKILFDIGFQLSILATLGLIYLLPSIEELFKRVFSIKKIGSFLEENLLGTISCTLSTLPIAISIFNKVSLVSVFANMLVLPLTESTMLYGTLSLLISFISSKIAVFIFSIPYIQLKLFEFIVEYFGGIKWGYVDVNSKWVGIAIGLFLVLFCFYFYPLDQENYYVKRLKGI